MNNDDCPFSYCEGFASVNRLANRIMCLAIFFAGVTIGHYIWR